MAELQTFSPGFGTGVNVTAGAGSLVAELLGAPSFTLCITNFGTDRAFIRTGNANAVATIADYAVPGGQQVTITVNPAHTHVAYIAPSGAPALQFLRGEGF